MSPSFEIFLGLLIAALISWMVYTDMTQRCDPDIEEHCRHYEHYSGIPSLGVQG